MEHQTPVQGEILSPSLDAKAIEERRKKGWANLIPVKKGEPSRNPAGRPPLERDIRLLARHATPAIMQRLIDMALDPATDDRVAFVAGNAVIERAWGKPKEPRPGEDDGAPQKVDLSKLSDKDLASFRKLVEKARVKKAE